MTLWIWQNEDGRRGEAALEGLERLLRLRAPVEPNLGRGQSVEGSSYCAKASDKPPVEVSKPEELLNFLAAIRRWLLDHSAHFSRIQLHPSRGYDKAQEGDGVGMKLTLFRFDIQVVVEKTLKNLANMASVSV